MSDRKLMDCKVYMLDSTFISPTLLLFNGAKYRTQKGAVKLHTLMDLPTYLHLTSGNVHDAQVAKTISVPAESVIMADRAYLDYANLYRWNSEGVHFLTRTKKNMEYEVCEDINLDSIRDDSTGANIDQYPAGVQLRYRGTQPHLNALSLKYCWLNTTTTTSSPQIPNSSSS